MNIDQLRHQVTDLDPNVRILALQQLVLSGVLPVPAPTHLVNLHCHTCYSYNAYGHTPSSLAWLAREQNWYAVATVDFDVLDAVDETLQACEVVGVRGGAGLETRVFVPEFSSREINSPGEPGICYFVGVGFTRQQAPQAVASTLQDMRTSAARRNREMVGRINAFVGPAAIDYDRDVLPLTPAGNATERHMLVAYDAAARRAFPNRANLVAFWAGKLGIDAAVVEASLGQEPGPNEMLRSKLMKRGSVGYVQPSPESFPTLQKVSRMIAACGALPTYAWLDGYSAGEQAIDELLAVMLANGVVGLTVIPERNWNFKDQALKAEHVSKLDNVMALAAKHDLPIFIGTEMNKAGQPLVDAIWSVEALKPYAETYINGANLLYGHTVLERTCRMGYSSAWAEANLKTRASRNAFYAEVGRRAQPGTAIKRLGCLGLDAAPAQVLAAL